MDFRNLFTVGFPIFLVLVVIFEFCLSYSLGDKAWGYAAVIALIIMTTPKIPNGRA